MSGTLEDQVQTFAEYVMSRRNRQFGQFTILNLSPQQRSWLSRETYRLFDARAQRIDQNPDKWATSTFGIFQKYPKPPKPPKELAIIVKGMRKVEVLLPYFASLILQVVKEDVGRLSFATGWIGEEHRHSLRLKWWEIYSGAATEEECYEADRETLGVGWDPRGTNPGFGETFYVLAYVGEQELRTAHAYRRLEKLALKHNQLALAEIARQNRYEENTHAEFFIGCCRLVQQLAPDHFSELMYKVHLDFDMPASYSLDLPEYSEWATLSQNLGLTADFRWAVTQWKRQAKGRLHAIDPNDPNLVQKAENWIARQEAWDEYVSGIGGLMHKLAIHPLPPDLQPQWKLAPLKKLVVPAHLHR